MPSGKCPATRPDGSECKAPPTDDGMCHWHSERHREARLASSRKGGLRRTVELPSEEPLTAEETRELVASVSRAVVKGSLDANTARSLTYLLSLDRQLRDSEALEKRIAQLESQLESVAAIPNVHRVDQRSGSIKDELKAKLKRGEHA